ncbi:hypothetical protein Lser_V15G12965 [Lactuca serriola]
MQLHKTQCSFCLIPLFPKYRFPILPMASNHHHHQCHCQPPNPTPPTTTCYCTMCYTTTHYPSPPPPPPDPVAHCFSSHLRHHPPPQTNLHAPPQNHHNIHTQHHDYYPPPPPADIHKKHQLFQKYVQQENVQENPLSVDSTVSSLIQRIAALESSLRRRKQSPGSSSLRNAAARTIQIHFRAFLVRRSVTLRHLKDLACIKSALNNLKASVSNKTHFDFHLLSRESMNLLIKLDAIQGSDPMIRDGKRSISRELIRFMEFIDEISTESRVISVKNIRFSKNGKQSVILQREHKIRASGSRALGDDRDERKSSENLRTQIKKPNRVSSVPKAEEEKVEIFEVENPRKHGVSQSRIGCLVKNQPKVKKNVSFDEKGNVYRVINRKHSPVSSGESDSSNGDDEEVEEIGVSSKEPEIEEEDSSEMSENEMDPRKNLGTRIHNTTNKNQPDQEGDDEEEEEEEEEEDSFVFSAPLPAKMEYRVDSANNKQTVKR